MQSISQIVSLPEWQTLRASLVGTWKKTPEENVRRLRAFLEAATPADRDRRLRILHNYLTGSGFRIGIISSPSISALLAEVRAARA